MLNTFPKHKHLITKEEDLFDLKEGLVAYLFISLLEQCLTLIISPEKYGTSLYCLQEKPVFDIFP